MGKPAFKCGDNRRLGRCRQVRVGQPLPPREPNGFREMEPLFLAVASGSNAGLLREALHEVYIPRIQRGGASFAANPSFPTRGIDDPRSRSRTTSWSKGLPHKRDVLGL